MPQKSCGDSQKWQDDIQREGVVFNAAGPIKLKVVVEGNRDTNHKGLSSLHPINPSQNVDGVGAKNSQHSHVNIIQNSWHNIEKTGQSAKRKKDF